MAGLLVAATGTAVGVDALRAADRPSDAAGRPAGLDCADLADGTADVRDLDDGALPAGAVAVQMCGPADGMPVPAEPLTRDVATVVEAVDDAGFVAPGTTCTLPWRPTWTLVVQYADGAVIPVHDDGSCGTFDLGGTEREGSEAVAATFVGALARQRAAQDAPASPATDPLPCDLGITTRNWMPPAEPGALHAITVCATDHTTSTVEGSVRPTPGEAAVIAEDFSARAELTGPPRDGCVERAGGTTITARDAWGDPVRLVATCDGYLGTVLGGSSTTWTPSPGVDALLRDLRARAVGG